MDYLGTLSRFGHGGPGKRKWPHGVLMAATIALTSCMSSNVGSGKEQNVPRREVARSDVLLKMKWSPCHGPCCASFTAIAFDNGTVLFDGRAGWATGDRLVVVERSDKEMGELRAGIDKVFLLAGGKDFTCQDGSTCGLDEAKVEILFRDHGNDRLMRHYHGDSTAPIEVSQAEYRLRELLGIERLLDCSP